MEDTLQVVLDLKRHLEAFPADQEAREVRVFLLIAQSLGVLQSSTDR